MIPKTVVKKIFEGTDDEETIELKERLTYGETQRLAGAGVKSMREVEEDVSDSEDEDGEPRKSRAEMDIDVERLNVATIDTWVVDWSLKDEDGRPVPKTKSSIRSLDPDTAGEIIAVITKHQSEYEEKKATKSQNGKSKIVAMRT